MKRSKNQSRRIEITVSVGGVIPTANYENYRPTYSVTDTITVNGNADQILSERTDQLREILAAKFAADFEKCRVEKITKQRFDIRWRKRGDKYYPSVTSVINAIEPIEYPEELLKQYASRGKIVDLMVEHYNKSGVWETDPLKVPGMSKADFLIVTQGSLKLSWTDCNFPGFCEKHGSDFKWGQKQVVFNDEHEYSGELDNFGFYKDRPAVIDFKTASTYDTPKLAKYFKQLAAYMKCCGGQVGVIVPLKPKNKSGFGAPIVLDDPAEIERYWMEFLSDRKAFRDIYGV